MLLLLYIESCAICLFILGKFLNRKCVFIMGQREYATKERITLLDLELACRCRTGQSVCEAAAAHADPAAGTPTGSLATCSGVPDRGGTSLRQVDFAEMFAARSSSPVATIACGCKVKTSRLCSA